MPLTVLKEKSELDYDQSLTLLKDAKGEVKTALVMEKLKMKFDDAKIILNEKDVALIEILGIYLNKS